jgi:murein hydrolase activator
VRFFTTICLIFLGSRAFSAALQMEGTDPSNGVVRAKELSEFIKKEKPKFQERENQKRDLLENLDKLNADENHVRERIAASQSSQQELTMSLENLSVEFQKQKTLEALEKKRVLLILKVLYQIKRDGLLRFLVFGDNLANFAARTRILYRTLRSHSSLTHQMEERSRRLTQSEKRLLRAQEEMKKVLNELNAQASILSELLAKKHEMLGRINHKQSYFQTAVKEYRQISKQIATLFENFESARDEEEGDSTGPALSTLPLPIEAGRLVKSFGRSVNERFGTVTYQKGIEIEADQGTKVSAILPGIVEYDGWVKGLGNVLIVHHGSGFYSLSAHLFKILKPKGSEVAQGETVGLVGDTGNNEKPSLYFELREKGKAVDPTSYFSSAAMQNLF